VKRLAEESARAMRAQSVRERFAADDALPVGSTPAEFSEFIRTEQARWSEVVLKAKIRPE
jgi:tripartite-type tricarboxylate transporter receptor subunit TctC